MRILPKKGDYFEVQLKATHISWGEHRHTFSRDHIPGENYIPIPRKDAIRIGIFNSQKEQGLGKNEFNAKSSDGYYSGVIKVSGNSYKGDYYAKNIAESGNLKGFSEWFHHANVSTETKLRIEWISETDILFTILT